MLLSMNIMSIISVFLSMPVFDIKLAVTDIYFDQIV